MNKMMAKKGPRRLYTSFQSSTRLRPSSMEEASKSGLLS
jgi:hypothetical protein